MILRPGMPSARATVGLIVSKSEFTNNQTTTPDPPAWGAKY